MIGIVACALEIPRLAEAMHARGLRLVPTSALAPAPREASAALFGWTPREGDPSRCIAGARARGWCGPLMLLLDGGGGASLARALDAGADDAVLLPASPGEIAARLAARIRHRADAGVSLGGLSIDPIDRRVTRDGQPIRLLPREYALLLYLARQHGRCVSRHELLGAVWGLRFDPGTNVVQVHVSRLRARLDRGFARPMLHTEKGRGYRLTE